MIYRFPAFVIGDKLASCLTRALLQVSSLSGSSLVPGIFYFHRKDWFMCSFTIIVRNVLISSNTLSDIGCLFCIAVGN